MADWEKMLKAYKECIDPDGNCFHCPYHEYGHIDPERCNRQVLDDVLELLKGQEPIEPYVSGNGTSFETASSWWYACGNCREPIDMKDKYCRHCGKAVKWDG